MHAARIADLVLDRSPRSNVTSVSCPTVANVARYESAQSLVAGRRRRVRARKRVSISAAHRRIRPSDQCNGRDVLIHEAYSLMTYNDVTRPYQEYREKHHTSSRELAELATKARPGLLILYHRANPGGVGRPNPEDVLLEELRAHYSGKVVTGHDLDVY